MYIELNYTTKQYKSLKSRNSIPNKILLDFLKIINHTNLNFYIFKG